MTHHAPITAAPVVDLAAARFAAQEVANACHAGYWMRATDCGDAFHVQHARADLEKLAALFGARLVWEDER